MHLRILFSGFKYSGWLPIGVICWKTRSYRAWYLVAPRDALGGHFGWTGVW